MYQSHGMVWDNIYIFKKMVGDFPASHGFGFSMGTSRCRTARDHIFRVGKMDWVFFEGSRDPGFSPIGFIRWWFQLKDFLIFTPETWGEDFQFDSYFSDGRVQPPPSIAIFVLLLGKHTSFGAGGVGYKQTNSGSYKWSLKSIGPRVDDMCFLICFL